MVAGPWITDVGLLVQLDNDQVRCYGTDLNGKWAVSVPNDKLACSPTLSGSQVVLTFSSGKVSLINSESGETVREFEIGEPIIHEPLRDGEQTVFAGRDGTVHVVDFSRSTER